jgi:outer membrane biosynthesis protein TonB
MALAPDDMTVAVIAVWALGFLYWPILHASRLRATFGKAILGLYVTRFDGRRISILRALWREVAKIFSGAVFMLGYVIAAVTPRKQALHDLMAATYVAREGVSRAFPALLVVLAGFATPVFVAPMVVDRAVQSAMEKIVMDAIAQYDPLKQPTRPAAPAMKVAPRNPAPAPAPAPAPKPAPVALAQPAPVAEPAKAVTEPQKPAAEPVKTVTEPAKTVKEPVKPKAAAAKQKQGPAPAVVRAAHPSPASSDFMLGSGPKYNDLMTAVLAHDVASVNELLKLGKWVDKPDSRGRTPLMVATALDDVPTAEALLRGGASPRPAFRVAEERGNGEMVALLKRYGSR